MRSTIFVAIGFFAAASSAQENPINVPKEGFPVFTAGKPTTFTWKPTTDGTVTLRLREGASSDLSEGTLIKANVPNTGSYTFTPPADTTRNSDYTIQIIDDINPSNVNYSPQFVIDSKNTVASITSASVSASASSASASGSASSSASTESASSTSASASASSESTSSRTNSMSRPASSSASSTESTGSASASATDSSASATEATSAPTGGAMRFNTEMPLGVGLLAAVFGVMAAL